ncbi:MAG: P1 family peptidase [Actinomycetia bacterium]|nr:P1 family peptidase [Actinomycetes bacterium]
MITEVPGLHVGHRSDAAARTGCTVVVGDEPFTASGEVRGSAPATREFALLDPSATVQSIDSVVLSGGSAFGLAAGDGVMAALDQRGRGFPTPWGRVPIVVGMSLFDLPVGDPTVRPTAADGAAALEDAFASPGCELGLVGAGTGATVSKWRGEEATRAGGLVGVAIRDGDLVVACLVAVNAWGDLVGSPEAGLAEPEIPDPSRGDDDGGGSFGGSRVANTTIGVVATNAEVSKMGCMHMARGAHDGLARAISPPHASVDGDAFVAISVGGVAAPQDKVRWLAVQAVQQAIATAA